MKAEAENDTRWLEGLKTTLGDEVEDAVEGASARVSTYLSLLTDYVRNIPALH